MNGLIALPALKDNYIWIYHLDRDRIIVVDPGESAPVLEYIAQHHCRVDSILLTHHHQDHIGGAMVLSELEQAPIYAPDDIPLPHISVSHLTQFQRGLLTIEVIPVPGHTLDHVAYLMNGILFCGDALFSGGCGRLFEGTFQMALNSLNRLKALPDETLVCPAHEYTKNNLRFGALYDPNNPHIQNALATLKPCSLPSTIAREKQINLFFYPDFSALKAQYHCNTDLDLFTFLRQEKDRF